MDALQDSLSAQADKHAKMIKVASIKAAVAEAIKTKEQEQLEAVEALAAQAENHASGLDAARSDTEAALARQREEHAASMKAAVAEAIKAKEQEQLMP